MFCELLTNKNRFSFICLFIILYIIYLLIIIISVSIYTVLFRVIVYIFLFRIFRNAQFAIYRLNFLPLTDKFEV